MSDVLIAAGFLGAAAVYLAYRVRTREERRRAKAIAEATEGRHEHLSAADTAFVAEHAATALLWKTDDHPVIGLDDPLGASPLDTYWRLPAVAVEDTPLFNQTVAHLLKPVPTWDELEFTRDVWNGGVTSEDVARMVADYKAGARHGN